MRGIRCPSPLRCCQRRFIPAHAGNSAAENICRAATPVHPRACGEFTRRAAADRQASGSSPRMRGIRSGGGGADRRRRFIPAHAGNSLPRRFRAGAPAVHPRACGEFALELPAVEAEHGSSPRMRGIPISRLDAEYEFRFIPAHAGNSSCGMRSSRTPTVHPRACGEFDLARGQVRTGCGSSPRMRGIRFRGPRTAAPARFIPAHAGNSAPGAFPHLREQVHPRACGEFGGLGDAVEESDGSSPRMRGIPASESMRHAYSRFIPAHAGNSEESGIVRFDAKVHPRACGEFTR